MRLPLSVRTCVAFVVMGLSAPFLAAWGLITYIRDMCREEN